MSCPFSWTLIGAGPLHLSFFGSIALLASSLINIGNATDRNPARVAEWAGIDRWQFELESDLVFEDDPEPSPTRPYVVHRLFAASPVGLYHFTGHDLDRRMVHVSWQSEPFNLETTLSAGKLVSNKYFNRCFKSREFAPDAELPHYIARDTLTFVVPVWPVKGCQSPQSKPGILLVVGEAVKSELYRRVNELAVVGDEECYVFEAVNHCDRISISRDKELCVMQREIKDPLTKTLSLSLVTKRIEQVRPGLWMPVEIEYSNFDGASSEREPKKLSTTVTRVLNWKFNTEIPDERFVPTLRPGTIEESGDSFHQFDAGGIDHLDEIAGFFVANRFPVRYERSKGNAATGVIVFIIAVAGGYCVSFAFSRSCQKSSLNNDSLASVN